MRGTTERASRAADALLGLGGTVDLEVRWDGDEISGLARHFELGIGDLIAPAHVRTERDILQAVLSHAADGSGGEYFVESSAALDGFIARFRSEITLGGTPVRAALAMSRAGVPSTVHLVSIDENVRRLLPSSVEMICSAELDSFDPHVIVQFPAGTSIRLGDHELVIPHPNRVILSNDLPNQLMAVHERFGDATADATVVLVSGFNSMRDERLLDRRLEDTLRHLARRLPTSVAWYEHGGFHVDGFSERVRSRLGPAVDIWSCNEDELAVHLGHPIRLLDAEDVLDAVRSLHRDVGAPTVLVHSRHWAVALGGDEVVRRSAIEGGIAAASARYAFGDDVQPEHLELVRLWRRQPDGVRFATRFEELGGTDVTAVSAFSIDAPHPTTIGLGDTFVGGALTALLELSHQSRA